MNMGSAKLSKVFYIILVPIILVIILLNSGFLQARVPAATVGSLRLNVAEYNYYYFTQLNAFIEENFDESGADGPFNQTSSLKTQYRDDGTSWRDYFCALAEEQMKEVAYYSAKAAADGYEFSEEELAPVQEKLDAIEADRLLNNVTLKNYLVAYWGVGMTETIFTAELTRQVKAEAYKAHLIETETVSDLAVEHWIAANQPKAYSAANLRMIVLDASEDRFTGQVDEQQLADLNMKLKQLTGRYEKDPSNFTQLAESFCDDADLAEASGVLPNATQETLSPVVARWVFSGDTQIGDYTSLMDEEAGEGYLVILDGWGEDAAQLTAVAALQQEQVTDEEVAALDSYSVSHNSLGARLVGR